jgi:hypothetical protein
VETGKVERIAMKGRHYLRIAKEIREEFGAENKGVLFSRFVSCFEEEGAELIRIATRGTEEELQEALHRADYGPESSGGPVAR